ncbi:glycine dehydrogenase [Formosa sp. PL04]|uniref:glycine dehydrogenase n=1 Tax=Formosa sp. PL04 TaxID=3081755 RepID=UPI002980D60C|nr:glycine dehydrogenase [Formosa sp. PL04]MDW5287797.1 glycine dehydrogenase [Formosa sp. PL04]
MSKLFLSCDEASHVCDKAQYNESTFLERLKLRMHIIFCSLCKKHTHTNMKLTESITKSKIVCLDAKSKSEMKKCFEKELKNSSSKD